VADEIRGRVIAVRQSGDLVTDITASRLAGVPRDERVSIACDGHVTAGIFPPDHGQPELTLLAVLGEQGVLELTLVGESATAFLGIQPGAVVTVRW
jgi:hypothetical protein